MLHVHYVRVDTFIVKWEFMCLWEITDIEDFRIPRILGCGYVYIALFTVDTMIRETGLFGKSCTMVTDCGGGVW